MKNESFLPDNQFLHVTATGGGIRFVLWEYGADGRKAACAAEFVSRRELSTARRQAVRLAVLIETMGERLEGYKKQRRHYGNP